MRYITIIISLILLGIACQPKEDAPAPESLEDYKTLLSSKKKELAALQIEIKSLTNKVAELDPSLQETSKLVEVSEMIPEDFVRYINIQGTVESEDPVSAVSEMPGRIISMTAKEGDYIKKGALVARLDVESVQKSIDEINTSLDLARDVYDRQSRLWSQNIGSEIQYLQAKNNVERLEKSLATVQHQLTKANIYAPISGVIDMVTTKQGEVVSPGMPIIQILNTAKLKVTSDLPERYLKDVKRGQMVDLNFPSLETSVKGKISRLGTKINQANRTIELEIHPVRKPHLMKPNMLTEIKLEEVSFDHVILLPLEYVQQEVDGKEFVYTVTQDDEGKSRAQKRYIQLGEAADSRVIITEGLTAGESVILKGARNLSDTELIEYSK